MMDLIVLVPGKDEAAAIDAMLARPQALGIRPIRWSIERHECRDPGCRIGAADYLRSSTRQFEHALVVFDREGCGAEDMSREQLEQIGQSRLSGSGWGDRAAVVVIAPELEIWIWSDSRYVDEALGWRGRRPVLREWLRQQGLLKRDAVKPERPKEAMESAMASVRKRRSSRVYSELASQVSLERCIDPSFGKFRTVLQTWFPPEDQP